METERTDGRPVAVSRTTDEVPSDQQPEGVSIAPQADLLRGQPGILVLFRRGDPATLKSIYWAYIGRIEQIIRRGLGWWRGRQDGRGMLSRDVEDLVQETFGRAFAPRARQAYDGQRDYGPYLSTIARRVLVDALRADRGLMFADTQVPPDDGADVETFFGEDSDWAEPETVAVVRAYLAGLPRELAEVHHQRYVLGLSQELAAAGLCLTRQRLRTLERKLRSGLKRALTKAGISSKE